ncbi:MAG: HIT domain-containing protein [Kangiellaceae bacterium]|nr:HIT domain-containing protein [Kangiellaceae bacterium]
MTFQLDSTLKSDSYIVGSFQLSLLLLMNDAQYPWFTLVPQRDNKTEIYELTESDQQLFWLESRILSTVMMDVLKGDKLNVAAIGNLVPQLHLHHVVRFKTDSCWPKPIWGQNPMIRYQELERDLIIKKILPKLSVFGFQPL